MYILSVDKDGSKKGFNEGYVAMRRRDIPAVAKRFYKDYHPYLKIESTIVHEGDVDKIRVQVNMKTPTRDIQDTVCFVKLNKK